MFNINFANDKIRTKDLWCRKKPLYLLSHNHCPQREREREREREDLFGRQFVLSDETSPVGVGHKWTNEIGLID